MNILHSSILSALGAALALMAPVSGLAASYTFQTLNNNADPTFNQLLGINNTGTIAGYFGSGAAGHPNKGYTLVPPYGQGNYTNENFPGSVQTQVTGLNNMGTTVGFWSNSNNGAPNDANFGWVKAGGQFTNVNNPNTPAGALTFNQLLAVNDKNVAVGFYTDANGATHGYSYTIGTRTFSADINDPNAMNATTTAGINNAGVIVGFYTDANQITHGFIDNGGKFMNLDAPGAGGTGTATSFLGINNNGLVDGVETLANGTITHGITYNINNGMFNVVDDPFGIGTTTLNGLNDRGQLTGFYTDGNGNTNGFLATPVPEPASVGFMLFGGVLLAAGCVRRKRSR